MKPPVMQIPTSTQALNFSLRAVKRHRLANKNISQQH
jgi:hypothetical protein